MKNKILVIVLFLGFIAKAETKAIPYTLEDRDRLLRVEENIKTLNVRFDDLNSKIDKRFEDMISRFDSKFDSLDSRFESIQKQIDFSNNLMLTLIAGLLGTVIYMWWDRRAANAPLKDAIEDESKKTKNLIKALKEYSDSHPELKTIFDRAAIL